MNIYTKSIKTNPITLHFPSICTFVELIRTSSMNHLNITYNSYTHIDKTFPKIMCIFTKNVCASSKFMCTLITLILNLQPPSNEGRVLLVPKE